MKIGKQILSILVSTCLVMGMLPVMFKNPNRIYLGWQLNIPQS